MSVVSLKLSVLFFSDAVSVIFRQALSFVFEGVSVGAYSEHFQLFYLRTCIISSYLNIRKIDLLHSYLLWSVSYFTAKCFSVMLCYV